MNYKYLIISILFLSILSYSQATEAIKPYPGTTGPTKDVQVVKEPWIPPAIMNIIIILGAIAAGFVLFALFILVVLIMIKMIFPPKPIREHEKMFKERIFLAKRWNGTNLDKLHLIGDPMTGVPPSTVGYCTGYKAESKFDYVTYHHGAPGILFLFKLFKGPKFQLHIPILDITIPEDRIIEIEPSKHGIPGRDFFIFASGLTPSHSGYEMPNTTDIPIHKRMEHERAELIARAHGRTASLIPEAAEKLWESSKEHFKKRDSEPSKAPAGK
jgi:hypothetical protein